MSNTTPESPEDRPEQEPLAATGSTPAAEPADATAAEPVEAKRDTDTGAHVAATPPATDDDVDDDPGVAEVAPVASSSHISGSSDTSQTRAYDSVDAEPSSRPPAGEYQPTTEYQPVTPGYAAQPMYVAAPERPKPKGNRGAGILVALLAAVVYAIVSALVVLVIFAITKRTTDAAMHDFVQYIGTASYYIPIIFFALAFILLIAIVNRGGWWAYILGAFFVGVIVYFAYVGGVLVTIQAWTFSPPEVGRILSQLWANPLTIGSAIVAREVPIWFGLWIASRGRKVRERNADARREYERALAEGPQPIQRTA